MGKKKVFHDPFLEYGDIAGNKNGDYRITEIRNYANSVYENEKNIEENTPPILPVSPYKTDLITKKATSIGRGRRTYSLSNELVMRIKLLCARINQELMQAGKKANCSESHLIEEGIRSVLKAKRHKYKETENEPT